MKELKTKQGIKCFKFKLDTNISIALKLEMQEYGI